MSDSRRAQLHQVATQGQIEQMVDQLPDALILLDHQEQIIYQNQAAQQLLGCAALGQRLGQVWPDLEAHPACQRAKQGEPQQFQLKQDLRTDRWLDVRVAPSGAGLSLVLRDISDRKRVEATLQEADLRVGAWFNQQFQFMAILTPDGTVLEANEACFRGTGVARSEVIGRKFWETPWWSQLPGMQALWPRSLTVLSGGDPVRGEGEYLMADGTVRYADYAITGLKDAASRVVNIIVEGRDVTDRKQSEAALLESEARYRTLANAVPLMVWINSADGTPEFLNARLYEYVGYENSPSLRQETDWVRHVHPEDIPAVVTTRSRGLTAGEAYELEVRICRFDGVYRWHLVRVIPIRNQQGQLLSWFGTATDIHDTKQLALDNAQLYREAQAANQIKDEFLAVLSHELRSPLNPILGWARLLQTRQFDPPATQRALETIERNARLQTQLIEDLLDVSRILRGKMVLNVAPVDLVTVIEAALETARLSAEAKAIGLGFQPCQTEPIQVQGDVNRLQQIVWNLLSNAIKFTPSGGRVEVRLERVGRWGDGEDGRDGGDREVEAELGLSPVQAMPNQASSAAALPPAPNTAPTIPSSRPPHSPSPPIARLTVTDSGRGIAPHFLPYVFESFRQEDGTTTRQFGGLGLGLAIVRHLTELHGGTVQAFSLGEGQGATFVVELPLIFHFSTPSLPHLHTPSLPASPLAGLQLLIVDDEADARELLLTLLTQQGATVRVADSAAEALRQLDQSQPDLLISDIGIPDVDGYMLMRQIRQTGCQIPAIALTAYARKEDEQQVLAAGFQAHLTKPVDEARLLNVIAALCGQSHCSEGAGEL